MTGSSILPVAEYKGKLYFLFGRDIGDTPGFACFGGGVEENETDDLFAAALREGAEEMKGFLGNPSQLRELIEKNGGHLPMVFDTSRSLYHAHLFRIAYDPMLPVYYNQNHAFLMSTMTRNHFKVNEYLFEKVEIDWMTLDDMKRRRSEFRPFYRKIVDEMVSKKDVILKFMHERKGVVSHPLLMTGKKNGKVGMKNTTRKVRKVSMKKVYK
jgi:hypothetical protein